VYCNIITDISSCLVSKLGLGALTDYPALIYFKVKAVERIMAQYSWDLVTDEYEALFRELIADCR
jgi:hypothetical protein